MQGSACRRYSSVLTMDTDAVASLALSAGLGGGRRSLGRRAAAGREPEGFKERSRSVGAQRRPPDSGGEWDGILEGWQKPVRSDNRRPGE